MSSADNRRKVGTAVEFSHGGAPVSHTHTRAGENNSHIVSSADLDVT